MKLIGKIFFPTCLTISVLLLFYTFYKSEIHWGGDKRDYYLIYYLISGILIIFSIITFYLNEKIKTYLIITLTSIVLTLYAFEGYLIYEERNWELTKKVKLYKEQTGKKYDTRIRFEVYEDLKKNDENIVVSIKPKLYLEDNADFFKIPLKKGQKKIIPLSGISNSKTIHCNENGYHTIYQSDRYGFNNPDSEWDQQEVEYLLVGDSFTHGACVNRPNDIASVLRTLSKKSVLSLGYGSNKYLIEYAALREYLKPNVKNILWLYFENYYPGSAEEELNSQILMNYLKDLDFSQNLKLKQNQINEMANQMIERHHAKKKKQSEHVISFTFKFIKFIKIFNIRYLIKTRLTQLEPHQSTRPEFKETLKQANDLALKNNSKLYFVYLPEHSRYISNYDNSTYHLVKNIVDELNIPFIDSHREVFKKEKNPLKLFPFELHGHYTVEGYRKVAEAIYKFISK